MSEIIKIYPDFEKLKGISALWDNEKESLDFPKSDYLKLSDIAKETNFQESTDNLCYVLILLRNEKTSLEIRKRSANERNTFKHDRLEVSKFLNLVQEKPDTVITEIKVSYSKIIDFDSKKVDYNTQKLGHFSIHDKTLIQDIIEMIYSKYAYKISIKPEYKQILEKTEKANKETNIRKQLVKNLYNYLNEDVNLGENNKYYIIGQLLFLSGIEPTLSINEFIHQNNYNPDLYKSYKDFVNTKIRTKYFKG